MEPLRSSDPKKLGKYTLIGRLGAGAMGVVYLGLDVRRDHSPHAIKVIASDKQGDPTYRERFKREIAVLRRLTSDRVARISRVNIAADPWWYASEFIPGITLHQAVAEAGGKLSAKQVLVLAHNLILALESFHPEIVHRDLKPQNIMISPGGAKVIDFGIAQSSTDPGITGSGVIIGTVSYMSPEQLCGKRATSASDIFALGGILVYAATGRQPFGMPHMSSAEVMSAILSGKANLSAVPPEVLPLVQSCLQMEPSKRGKIHQLRSMLPGSATDKVSAREMMGPKVDAAIAAKVATQETMTARVVPTVKPPHPLGRDGVQRNPLSKKERLKEIRLRRRVNINQLRASHLPVQRKPEETDAEYKIRLKTQKIAYEKAAMRELQRANEDRKAAGIMHPGLKFLLTTLLIIGVCSPVAWNCKAVIAKVRHAIETQDSAAQRDLPKARFTAAKTFGVTSDPSRPGTHMRVTDVKASGYHLTVEVELDGYGADGKAALAESCIVIDKGKLTASSFAQTTEGRHGTIVFNLFSSGTYQLKPKCSTKSDGVQMAAIGNNAIKILGRMTFEGESPVILARRKVDDGVIVTMPAYDDFAPSHVCAKDERGKVVKADGVNRFAVEDNYFDDITFKGLKNGTLYHSCGQKNGKTVFNGTGVSLK